MRRNKGERAITRADQAARLATEAGRSTGLQQMISNATRCATTSLSGIAEQAGISDSTLSSWRRGLRVPTPEALEVLADVLEERGRMIQSYATELRHNAGRLRTPIGRVSLLLEGRLRTRLLRRLSPGEFERALQERLTERPDADVMLEAEALAREMIGAKDDAQAAAD